MKGKIKRKQAFAYNRLMEIIFPPRCVICETILPSGEAVCESCRKKLPFIGAQYCMKCGKPIDCETKEYCEDCSRKKHYFTRGVALWTYSLSLKKSLYRFKYDNKRYYASYYADEAVKRYRSLLMSWGVDVIVPVPLHASKLRSRGYNQAEVFAKELGARLGIQVLSSLIVRVRKTTPQKQLNDKERIKNVKNAFKIVRNSVKLNKALLVDDIYTTGSTVDEISRILLQAGAKEIYVMTLCIGNGY